MYEKMTYDNILRDMLGQVSGPVSTEEGSLTRTAVAPAAYEIERCYIELDVILKQMFCDTADFEYLKKIASAHGIEAYKPGYTVAKGRFDREIPVKSRFSIGKYHYVSGKRLNEETYEYEMTCEEPGSAPNLILGNLVAIEYIERLGTAELVEILTPGNDEEEEEHFRSRFLQAVRKPSSSGNVYDYYNWATECSGVGAAKVFPLADGPGTVKIAITNAAKSAAEPGLIEKVKNHIESLRPIGAAVTVISAVEKKINVTAKIKLEKGLNLGAVQDEFLKSFSELLETGAFQDTYISLAKVGNLLLGTLGVEDFCDLAMNGESKNVPLGKEEVAVAGTIMLEVM